MPVCFLKRVLPFALMLALGTALGNLAPPQSPEEAANVLRMPARLADTDAAAAPLASPELHVLSTDLISENILYAGEGRDFRNVRILSPANSQYMAAKPGEFKQGVLQLSVMFGADGRVSEITPLKRPHVCGLCLPVGESVVRIDPAAPQTRRLTETAMEAVGQIKFIPAQSEGRSVSTHGVVECVFRVN